MTNYFSLCFEAKFFPWSGMNKCSGAVIRQQACKSSCSSFCSHYASPIFHNSEWGEIGQHCPVRSQSIFAMEAPSKLVNTWSLTKIYGSNMASDSSKYTEATIILQSFAHLCYVSDLQKVGSLTHLLSS